MKKYFYLIISLLIIFSCNQKKVDNESNIENKLKKYAEVELTSSLENLSEQELQMLPIMFQVADIMDMIFKYEALGHKDTLCTEFKNELEKKLYEINYGPWDRLNNNKPFMDCAGKKRPGANFYPTVMPKEEFEEFEDSCKMSPYTFIRRNESGELYCLPYHEAFKDLLNRTSTLLNQAAYISNNQNFSNYLIKKAEALLTDQYLESDTAWLNTKDNILDLVIGPIDISEDQLFGYKAEHQAYILIKDIEWSKRLEKYSKWLRFLQKALPVPEEYRKEEPGEHSEIFVYDVIYYAGSAKAGGAMLSINLPFDNNVKSLKGDRTLQFKNVIKNKFECITLPISEIIFENKEQNLVTAEAFFTNSLFNEMAKSLGIKNTLNNRGTVRDALKEYSVVMELVKADMVGLFLAKKMKEVNELDHDLDESYASFVANLFRRVRLSMTSQYAQSTLIIFNYFIQQQAVDFKINNQISIDTKKLETTIDQLIEEIIIIQGNGDYQKAKEFYEKYTVINSKMKKLLDEINDAEIPVDISFIQGPEICGL